MALSLVSLLSLVAFAYARPQAARSAFENKGGKDLSLRGGQEEADNNPPSSCDCSDVRMELGQRCSGVY
jgi:hypothetical protein